MNTEQALDQAAIDLRLRLSVLHAKKTIPAVLLTTDKHPKQQAFIESEAKRNVIRAGRRGGKTVGVSIRAVKRFLAGRRVLYAAPTQEQIDRFWVEVCRALRPAILAKRVTKNETKHLIEVPGTEQRIRAKTAWNADSLRGDYADELILDEWQLMNEDAWRLVGAPMLLDNDGNATFIYTPPSLHSRSASKADDPQHAAKLFKKAAADKSGRWATFHFGSKDNPYIDATAIEELAQDMTALAYRMEIEAEDVDEAPGALWTRAVIEEGRVIQAPELEWVVVGVDPSATADGDEAGIMTAGRANGHAYLLSDDSAQGSPTVWATAAVEAYHKHKANAIVAEANNGGEMVSLTIATVDSKAAWLRVSPDKDVREFPEDALVVPVRLVHASRGKQTRAEPVSALYEHGRGHHVGQFEALEDEMCLWMPGDDSPNRMDALVWAITELRLFRWLAPGPSREEVIEKKTVEIFKGRTFDDIMALPPNLRDGALHAYQEKRAEVAKREGEKVIVSNIVKNRRRR